MKLVTERLGLVLAFALFVGCGDDNDENKETGEDAGSSGNDAAALTTDSSLPDAAEDNDAATSTLTWCLDGIKQKGEDCDDGNPNEEDGCTTLCEFSCEEDSQCDDGNPCNGEENCNTQKHRCSLGTTADDGIICGDGATCVVGICRDNVCGDKIKFGSEECDHGANNGKPDNGCTSDCKFACVPGDNKRDCAATEQCAAPLACNSENHVCEVAGSATADKSPCDLNGVATGGWCIDGQCVPTNCGDGEVGGSEECDTGKDKSGSTVQCSADCKIVDCGNGRIEPGEQCDDGNHTNLDGCDSKCKPEIVHRLTRMDLVSGTPPSYCKYYDPNDPSKGNAFANAFMGKLDLSRYGYGVLNIIDLVNRFLSSAIDSGTTNAMVQTLDAEDPSGKTPDNSIRLALYSGVIPPDRSLNGVAPPVDFSFLVEARDVTGDNQPASVMSARLEAGGLIRTTVPADANIRSPVGRFRMYNVMSVSTLDVASATSLPPPPTVIPEVKVPQYIRNPDYLGIFCGAISAQSLAEIPLGGNETNTMLAFCCYDTKVRDTPYKGCTEGDVPGQDCDTFLDLMKGGCDISPSGCGNDPHYPFIYPTPPDVNVDDSDPNNDGYSVVIGLEGQRAKIIGVEPAK